MTDQGVSDSVLGPDGKPARTRTQRDDGRCPQCKAPREARVPSGGFGDRVPICGRCGHEFTGEKCDD